MTRVGLEPTTSGFVLLLATTAHRGFEKPRPFRSHKLHHNPPNAETNPSGLFNTTLDLPKADFPNPASPPVYLHNHDNFMIDICLCFRVFDQPLGTPASQTIPKSRLCGDWWTLRTRVAYNWQKASQWIHRPQSQAFILPTPIHSILQLGKSAKIRYIFFFWYWCKMIVERFRTFDWVGWIFIQEKCLGLHIQPLFMKTENNLSKYWCFWMIKLNFCTRDSKWWGARSKI